MIQAPELSYESSLKHAAELVKACLNSGGMVLILGVGGNAATASHLAAELLGKFETSETPYPAISLTDNHCAVTAITNDFGWDQVFCRQIRAFGRQGDVLIAFTIGGGGKYLENALGEAHSLGMHVVLSIGSGTAAVIKGLGEGDALVCHHSVDTPWVQNRQMEFVHDLCRKVKLAEEEV